MLINHVFFYVGFSTKACHGFGRPQTWGLNIYICVGASLIGWLDGKHTLPHDFFSLIRHVRLRFPRLMACGWIIFNIVYCILIMMVHLLLMMLVSVFNGRISFSNIVVVGR